MGRDIDWHALPKIAALLGIDDLEWLIEGLSDIREHVERIQRH